MDKSRFNDKKEWRKFAIGLALIVAAIGALLVFKGNPLHVWMFGAAGVLLIVAFAFPVAIRPLFILFSYLGFYMGWFMTRVILVILYYVGLTPISLLARLTGKRFLELKPDRERESYWQDKEPPADGVASFENQY